MTKSVRRPTVFYGWWVITACSLILFMSGASRFSFTLFFPTLLEDLGWSRATLGFGLTLHMWVYAVTVVIVGFMVDKYGARVVMTLGGFIIMLGLSLTSSMTTIWQFYLYYGVILAVGVAFTFMVPNTGTARKWFIKKAGLALAITALGASLGAAVMAYVIPVMIHAYGWRSSWLYLGLILGAAIILPAGIIIRKDPESIGLYPDGDSAPPMDSHVEEKEEDTPVYVEESWTVREALRTRSFWCILFAGSIAAIPGIGISGHFVNWGLDIARAAGISPEIAMGRIKLSITLSVIGMIIGSFIGGPLSDRIGRKPVILTGLALTVPVFLYAAQISTMSGVVVAPAFMGFFGGLAGPVLGAYLGDIFGRSALTSIFGLIIFAIGIIGGSGAVFFGWLYDVTGTYKLAWIVSAICTIIALWLYALTRLEKKPSLGSLENIS